MKAEMQEASVQQWRRQADSLLKHAEAVHGHAARLPPGKKKEEFLKVAMKFSENSQRAAKRADEAGCCLLRRRRLVSTQFID